MPDNGEHLSVRALTVPAPKLFHKPGVLEEAKLVEEAPQEPGVIEKCTTSTKPAVAKLHDLECLEQAGTQLPVGRGEGGVRLDEQPREKVNRDVPFVANGRLPHADQQVRDAVEGLAEQEGQHFVVCGARRRVQDPVQELRETLFLRVAVRERTHVHWRTSLDDAEPHRHLTTTVAADFRIVVGAEGHSTLAHFVSNCSISLR